MQAFFGHVSTLGCLYVRIKRFPRTSLRKIAMTCVNLAFSRTRKLNEVRPDGDGGFRRSSPLRGSPPFSGANAGSTLRPHPGQVTAKRGDARNGK